MKTITLEQIKSNLKSVVTLLILNYEQYAKELQYFAPKIYSEIHSFRTTPTCSCVDTIKRYVGLNLDRIAEFTYKFIETNNVRADILLNILEEKNISGKIIRIPKDDLIYAQTIKSLKDKGMHFDGISVVNEATEWVLYFY